MKRNAKDLTRGSLVRQMFDLTWPGIGGSLAIFIFNLTDTFFVSRLGTDALAAMGFTFPVVMVVGSVAMGISQGSASVLSRALGRGDRHKMKRTATDGVLLSVIFVGIISLGGIFSMDFLFTAMGAKKETLALVKDFMFIWYLGAMTNVMPPVSDSCLRATGDMVRPLIVMLVCAVGNAVLDPILIFGYLGFPAMGIQGAALATVISRFFGMITTLGFLHFSAGLVDFSRPRFSEILQSWKGILHVGIPSALTQLLPPLTRGILTTTAAAGGTAVVAALAVGSRIEGFSSILLGAFSMALMPLVGQNWGAQKGERIDRIRSLSLYFALIYGMAVLFAALLFARPLVSLFSNDKDVLPLAAFYIKAMGVSTAALCYYSWIGQSFNAAGKPRYSVMMNIFSSLSVIGLSTLGFRLWGFAGLAAGLALGQLLTALWAWKTGRRYLRLS